MERLNTILKYYINKLERDYRTAIETSNATPELSFRPALDDFLEQISKYINPQIDRIFEPRQQGKYGRPDWLSVIIPQWESMVMLKQKDSTPTSHLIHVITRTKLRGICIWETLSF